MGSTSFGNAAPASPEAEQCRRNLHLIFDAMQEYLREHQSYPPRLRDLVPRYLRDARYLACPLAEAQADRQQDRENVPVVGLPDPLTTYDFELGLDRLRSEVWSGPPKTSRDYRLRQRELIGDGVPMIRCLKKHPRHLNLAFDRRVYESDLYWEVLFRHVIPHPQLYPEWVLSDRLPVARRLKARAVEAPSSCLDLTQFYNGHLNDEWFSPELLTANSLSQFPAGMFSARGIQFDARGILQLEGNCFPSFFPDGITNIPVRMKARKLHLLHGTYSEETQGVAVAQLRLNYSAGEPFVFPIRYGIDVAGWWFDPMAGNAGTPSPGNVAWVGNNAAAGGSGKRLRLYASTFEHPKPAAEIQSIDCLSTLSRSAPFFLAITLE
jgi:hypothetical protein